MARRFFAHSISPASSLRGMKRCGGGSAFASEEISGALESRTWGTALPVARSQSLPRCESAAAWNVRASTPSTPSAARRARSSPAAFSVNVTARIAEGEKAPGGDLVGDPPRDGGGLAGAGAGQDRDRTAHRRRGLPLLVVETVQDRVEVGHVAQRNGALRPGSRRP